MKIVAIYSLQLGTESRYVLVLNEHTQEAILVINETPRAAVKPDPAREDVQAPENITA